MTYLGHSLLYDVKVDWLDLEVRAPAIEAEHRFQPGDQVSVWWDRRSDWLLPADGSLTAHAPDDLDYSDPDGSGDDA